MNRKANHTVSTLAESFCYQCIENLCNKLHKKPWRVGMKASNRKVQKLCKN